MTGVGDRVVCVTARDESVFQWFQIVRIANVQGVRWVQGGLNGSNRPVSVRRAQQWCARMDTAGLAEQVQLGGRGGALMWATHAATWLSKPNLYRQTTRHEVAVAAASARYATAGYAWQRDEKPETAGSRQADGVANGLDGVELIEVELTPKRMPRYVSIFTAYRSRLDRGEAHHVTYLCNPDAARAVRTALTSLVPGRAIAPQVQVREVYNPAGLWLDDTLPAWMMTASTRAALDERAAAPRRHSSQTTTLF